MEIYKRGIFVYIDLTEIVIVIVFRVNRHWVIRIFKRSLYGVTLCKKRKKEQWKLLKPEFIRKISEFDCSENVFFSFSQTLTFSRTAGDHLLLHSTISTRPRTLRHLFATLHVRWLSRIFNRNVCFYQTATRWALSPYRTTIWVIDWWCNDCLFTWLIDPRFLLHRFDIGNRSIWARIDYHPCITSEPTNQVC